jgi:hypothetical protein
MRNNKQRGEGRRKVRKFQKTNKNHYPDPFWVWQQIENDFPASDFTDKLEKKYELKKHGNLGTKRKK